MYMDPNMKPATAWAVGTVVVVAIVAATAWFSFHPVGPMEQHSTPPRASAASSTPLVPYSYDNAAPLVIKATTKTGTVSYSETISIPKCALAVAFPTAADATHASLEIHISEVSSVCSGSGSDMSTRTFVSAPLQFSGNTPPTLTSVTINGAPAQFTLAQ